MWGKIGPPKTVVSTTRRLIKPSHVYKMLILGRIGDIQTEQMYFCHSWIRAQQSPKSCTVFWFSCSPLNPSAVHQVLHVFILSAYPAQGHGKLESIPACNGWEGLTAWTSHQSITGDSWSLCVFITCVVGTLIYLGSNIMGRKRQNVPIL